MTYSTNQEEFWAGEFGEAYISRNIDDNLAAANLALFGRILRRAGAVGSVLEFGANVGMNLRALRQLLPQASLTALEINPAAAARLRELEGVEVIEGSLLDYDTANSRDLVFTKGVLIHLAPEALSLAYEKMALAARRYVMMCEYYSQSPVAVEYRGYGDKLYKRDFAGEFLQRHGNFRLIDYGFAYRGDPVFSQDDCTWFLMEKIAP